MIGRRLDNRSRIIAALSALGNVEASGTLALVTWTLSHVDPEPLNLQGLRDLPLLYTHTNTPSFHHLIVDGRRLQPSEDTVAGLLGLMRLHEQPAAASDSTANQRESISLHFTSTS